MNIEKNITTLRNNLDSKCQIIAVSKTHPVSAIRQAYDAGQRDFGENKVQELVKKYSECPKDIRWHMIGHLQTNKVKYIAPFVHLIQSVDSLKLLKEINKQGLKHNRKINVLLQVLIAEETTKFGLPLTEINDTFLAYSATLSHVYISGLMGMATHSQNKEKTKNEFKQLHSLFQNLKSKNLPPNIKMQTLSMGMSQDYTTALATGSNMIRIGSVLFGSR